MADYDIEAAFSAIEDELIESMMRNMKRHRLEEITEDKQWEMWQAMQLEALERYKKENRKRFSGRFSDINDQIDDLIREANKRGSMDQEVKILQAIKNGFSGFRQASDAMQGEFFKLNERKLDALIKATTDDMKKAEVAILRMADDQYRKAIFNAQVYANTGAGTYEKAVDMATKDMCSAGLNCVEYANGARHTLADYADMALRTASKRAYLQGEGTMRQNWGITTVIVNKRGNPCPKCLPFCGRVFIDDVWSRGSSNGISPVTGLKYPLISSAVKAGLYHPRCHDSHTTYFEGVNTPPDGKYTRDELDEIAQKYQVQQKKQYAERQAEKFERLAKHSLDNDNKKRYQARADEWEKRQAGEKLEIPITDNKDDYTYSQQVLDVAVADKSFKKPIEKASRSDIMESDLGAFKEKLRDDENIGKEYYTALKDKFSHGKDDAKAAFVKFVPKESVEDTFWEGTAQYNPTTKKISMHYGADLRNNRGAGATWFHEHGHMIDDMAGEISQDKEFYELLRKDKFEYTSKIIKEHKLNGAKGVKEAYHIIESELSDMRSQSGVSDIFNGLSAGKIKGCGYHVDTYWTSASVPREAFAHMFEAQFDEIRYEQMKKYFPNALSYFEKMLKEAAK